MNITSISYTKTGQVTISVSGGRSKDDQIFLRFSSQQNLHAALALLEYTAGIRLSIPERKRSGLPKGITKRPTR